MPRRSARFLAGAITVWVVSAVLADVRYPTLGNSGVVGTGRPEGTNEFPESLPAEQDVAGSWGDPVSGFQLSVRFEKTEFEFGEPVVATVILRHLEDQNCLITATSPRELDFNFIGTNEQGRQVVAVPAASFEKAFRLSSVGVEAFYGRSQRKYKVQVDDKYDLRTPGVYWIAATRYVPKGPEAYQEEVITNRVPRADGKGESVNLLTVAWPSPDRRTMTLLQSGNAKIRILDSRPAPAEGIRAGDAQPPEPRGSGLPALGPSAQARATGQADLTETAPDRASRTSSIPKMNAVHLASADKPLQAADPSPRENYHWRLRDATFAMILIGMAAFAAWLIVRRKP